MTANNRPWTEREISILTMCLDNGWSSGQAALRLHRTALSCRTKASTIGRPFGGGGDVLHEVDPHLAKDHAYVRRCIQAWPYGFGRHLLREVRAQDLSQSSTDHAQHLASRPPPPRIGRPPTRSVAP